jgi:molybdopterin converting factor subunit 1|tara:strand:+ start:15 stop:263 length:249 start_codon:yes stop_codon:yes gene_type:complete
MIIKYFAWLKNFTNTEEERIDNKNITDVKTLKEFLLKKYPELSQYMKDDEFIRVAINLEYVTTNKTIDPKDEIALFPPVSGG